MNNKSCFFIGHREASTEILPALRAQLNNIFLNMALQSLLLVAMAGLTVLQPAL